MNASHLTSGRFYKGGFFYWNATGSKKGKKDKKGKEAAILPFLSFLPFLLPLCITLKDAYFVKAS